MSPLDLIRVLGKAETALAWAAKHFTHEGEMNAALHMSDKVMYAPLASTVSMALVDVQRTLEILRAEDDAR